MSQTTNDSIDHGSDAHDLALSDRYSLLSDARRRVTLSVLSEHEPPVALEALASAVATREANDRQPSERAVEEVAISLHHAHLPLMADLDVLEYDPETNRVEHVASVSNVPMA